MKISCIIPFHDQPILLARACESIVAQVLPDEINIEIVVSNDGNFPLPFLRSLLDPILRPGIELLLVNNPYKKCAGYNRNSAIESSTGEVLAFLDADDVWLPSKLSEQLKLLKSGCTFIASSYQLNDEGPVICPPKALHADSLFFFLIRPIGTSTVVISRTLLGTLRFSSLRFCQDLLFWSLLARQPGFCYGFIPAPQVLYFSKSGRTSSTPFLVHLNYYFKAARLSGYNRFLSMASVLFYAARAFINKHLRQYFLLLVGFFSG